MNRRGFLAKLAAAPIVALMAFKAPELRPHTLGSFGAEPTVAGDLESGIAVRFVRQFDIEIDRHPTWRDMVWMMPDVS